MQVRVTPVQNLRMFAPLVVWRLVVSVVTAECLRAASLHSFDEPSTSELKP
jgi:hypothetical protein